MMIEITERDRQMAQAFLNEGWPRGAVCHGKSVDRDDLARLIVTVNIALRRQIMQLQHFTGNMHRELPIARPQTFAELRAFADTHAPTRAWIEQCKDELVAEFGHEFIVRIMAEDLLVCGAACFERGEPVDVATISLLLDEHGETPAPPAPAYEQTIDDERNLFTTDYLTYLRLPSSGDLYASSPVEQFMKVRQVVKKFLERSTA